MSDRSKKLLTPLSKSEQGLIKGGFLSEHTKMKIAMRRNFLIALICCCCSFINLSAQELRGVVMDSKQHPISYATIQVLEANDSSYVDGGMSNEKGFFQFQSLIFTKITY